ncbi:ROK family protein [Paenibacillus piri]|nr:ROK family protein [Paenibacillus piri]
MTLTFISNVIRSAAESGWHNVDVGGLMKNETGLTTVVVNRHRARGLAECRYGGDLQYRHMIYIGVGSGIAAGLYIDRQLLSGPRGGAGEIGHTTVEPDGPLCPCGNHGCLQLLSAGPAIEQEYRKTIRQSNHTQSFTDRGIDLQLVKAQDVCAAAENGDDLAIGVVKKAADYLGIAMANLLNTFNPEAIILGGFVPNASSLFVETAMKTMRQRAMHPLSSETVVMTSRFKEIGGALGAANFALDKYISLSFF